MRAAFSYPPTSLSRLDCATPIGWSRWPRRAPATGSLVPQGKCGHPQDLALTGPFTPTILCPVGSGGLLPAGLKGKPVTPSMAIPALPRSGNWERSRHTALRPDALGSGGSRRRPPPPCPRVRRPADSRAKHSARCRLRSLRGEDGWRRGTARGDVLSPVAVAATPSFHARRPPPAPVPARAGAACTTP